MNRYFIGVDIDWIAEFTYSMIHDMNIKFIDAEFY